MLLEQYRVWLFAGGLVLLALISIVAVIFARRKPKFKSRGQLLLLNEQRFLIALKQAVPPNIMISVKVRLLDIVASSGSGSKSYEKKMYDQVADFVLIDPDTTQVRLCIEMDAHSQSLAQRMAKNTYGERALRRAGIPFIRLPLVRYYDADKLRVVIRTALQGSEEIIKR
ncbi:MAG TPA: DUF2726 domain-containing protein [Alphaproteobacteria bacterium]